MAAYYKTESVNFTVTPTKNKEIKSQGSDLTNESNQKEVVPKLNNGNINGSRSYFNDDEDDEKYFEDDFVTGKLCYSSDNLDQISSDEEEIGSEELTVTASQKTAKDLVLQSESEVGYSHFIKGLNSTKDESFIRHSEKIQPSLYLSLENSSLNSKNPQEGFLFDEQASDELPDKRLLKKIQTCFDEEKIKDAYVLSGKIQDLLSPSEVKEIVTHSDRYSGYIEDEMFEVLASLHDNNANGSKNIMNDNEIRTVLEHQKNITVSPLSPINPNITHFQLSHSNSNIKAFFEESLIKSSSTLKRISPDKKLNISISQIDADFLESSVESSVSLNGTFTSSFNSQSIADNSIILRPDTLQDLNDSFNSTNTVLSNSSKCNYFQADRPANLVNGFNKKKITCTSEMSNPLEEDDKSLSSLSNKSDLFSPVEDMVTPDDIDTPDLDEPHLEKVQNKIPELTAMEELDDERSWKVCMVGNVRRRIDLKVIEPYKKVLSHGGYFGESRQAIIVFSACYLPDRSRRDYNYVMDNLFLYVVTSLDELVAEDYVLIYLHGATERGNMPSFGWLKRCYQMIDRRLRKNLKGLYLVHPTFWLKTLVLMTRPFVSSKFSRKLKFVTNLKALSELIPMDHICIPEKVKRLDNLGVTSPVLKQ